MPFFRIYTVRVFEVPGSSQEDAEAIFTKLDKRQRDAFERSDLNHMRVEGVV